MSAWRPFVMVLLPLAAGYYLSYVFRTINALIAGTLTRELALSAADLGFLHRSTSWPWPRCSSRSASYSIVMDRVACRARVCYLPSQARASLPAPKLCPA